VSQRGVVEIVSRRLALALACFALAIVAGAAAAGNADAGRDIAATCAACHGTDGHSRAEMPGLAGRDAKELVRQMRDFRDGRRPSTIMQQLAKGYTDAEIEAAAAYFAAQKAP
jgi:cytochrome subunit of sulfide dehydrogenase